MTHYVPLGIHTEYSLLHGMCRVEPLVARARALQLTAVGIADLHSTYGFVPLQRAARAAGLHPIFGVTVRLEPGAMEQGRAKTAETDVPAHVVLLARDAQGCRNLLRLLSQVHLESGDQEPCATLEDLDRFHAGLVALDGGVRGPVAWALVHGLSRQAERSAAALRDIFGPDAFYMEVQRHGTPDEMLVEPFVLRLARTLNVPLVATNDVRYLEPADAEAYEVLRCIGSGQALADPGRRPLAGGQHSLKSDVEMRQLFRDLPEALANTRVVAEKCSAEFDLGADRVAEVVTPSGRPPLEDLRRECERGARRRYGTAHSYQDLPVAVRDRIAHELAVIEEMKLASYFLIVQDVVRYAREEGIPVGPGRGSAAGSLVAYVLGVTDVDPLEHGLLFERFLSRRRPELPDIALDVGHTRRDEIVEYARGKFGADRVAHLGGLGTLSMRAVTREVGRVLGLRPEELDEIARWGRQETGAGLGEALEQSPRLRQAYQEDARIRRLLDVARRLEGLPRCSSPHAGGLVIAPGPLTDYVALQRAVAGEIVAQVTSDHAEALSLLRIDLSGLRSLSVVQGTVALVERHADAEIDIDRLPLDDEATFRMLARGDTACVFQLESAGMQGLLRDIQPSRFQDLVAALSLYRPGPLGAGQVEHFRARRSGLEPVTYAHPDLEPILEETNGILLYQEQLMQVAAVIAGYDLEEAELLRYAVARREIGDLARQRARFLRGALERGVELRVGEKVFDQLLRFANFGFDKAHSTSYALLAYRAAFLRAHYPLEYVLAVLDNSRGQRERLREAVADAVAHGIAILDPDINLSEKGYTAAEGGIRVGLAQVEHLKEAQVEDILEKREASGPFLSLYDFCWRMRGLPRRGITSLIKAGAFGCLGHSRAQALSMLEETLRAAERGGGAAAPSAQLAFDFAAGGQAGEVVPVPDIPELPEDVLAEMEREALGVRIHHDPVVRHAALWLRWGLQSSALLDELPERATVRMGGVLRRVTETATRQGEPMAFLELEDLRGRFEVVVFPELMARASSQLARADASGGVVVVVQGTIQRQGDGRRLRAEALEWPRSDAGVRVMRLPSRGSMSMAAASRASALEADAGDQQGGPQQPDAERCAGRLAASEAADTAEASASPEVEACREAATSREKANPPQTRRNPTAPESSPQRRPWRLPRGSGRGPRSAAKRRYGS